MIVSRTALGLCVALAAGLMTACESATHAVTRSLNEDYLPYFGKTYGLAAVPDWRRLSRPTSPMRERLALDSTTYRVIESSRDRAELAVWATMPAGPEPFNGNEVATGHGCVTVVRNSSGQVDSQVGRCPAELGPTPDAEQVSWGRNSNALQAADALVREADARLTALLRHGLVPTARILAAVRSRTTSPTGRVTASLAGRQHADRLHIEVATVATAEDPVDTGRTVTTHRCARVVVDRTDPHAADPYRISPIRSCD